MKARLTALISTLLLAFSSHLFAIGLGDITLESGLNEPLKARIALTQVGDLKPIELLVNTASADDFAARKMNRDAVYGSFMYKVDLEHAAGPCIVITTQQAIKEPSLDFLVELQWPTGKLVRGYTVLLEKP